MNHINESLDMIDSFCEKAYKIYRPPKILTEQFRLINAQMEIVTEQIKIIEMLNSDDMDIETEEYSMECDKACNYIEYLYSKRNDLKKYSNFYCEQFEILNRQLNIFEEMLKTLKISANDFHLSNFQGTKQEALAEILKPYMESSIADREDSIDFLDSEKYKNDKQYARIVKSKLKIAVKNYAEDAITERMYLVYDICLVNGLHISFLLTDVKLYLRGIFFEDDKYETFSINIKDIKTRIDYYEGFYFLDLILYNKDEMNMISIYFGKNKKEVRTVQRMLDEFRETVLYYDMGAGANQGGTII